MELNFSLSNRIKEKGQILTNAVKRGLGSMGVTLTTSKTDKLNDLSDLILVDRNIKNTRTAMEIDDTVWASVVSYMIISNISFEIVGDKGVNPEALAHIQDKVEEWKLGPLFDEVILKYFTDGECFTRKLIDPEIDANTISAVDILAYDEEDYDILALEDWKTGKVKGYIQKAKVVDYPDNWMEKSFDELAKIEETEEEFHFEPDQIIHCKLMEADKIAINFLYKVLDPVFIKKTIINMFPKLVRRAGMTLGVEVGNADVDILTPDMQGLSPSEAAAKAQTKFTQISNEFTSLINKENILHEYGIRPYMIGEGKLIDVIPYLEYLENRIRTSLLTPDSKFESSKGSRFTAEQQLTGGMGQTTVISYIRDSLISQFEPGLIDHELELMKFEKDKGKIHIEFEGLELDDEVAMSNIANMLINAGEDREVVYNVYLPRYAAAKAEALEDGNPDDSKNNPTDGIIEPTPKEVGLVNAFRDKIKSGAFKGVIEYEKQ